MAPKRKTEDDADTSKSPRKTSKPKAWSAEEEAAFDKHVYELVKAGLWARVKTDPLLAGRGANGIASHWDSKFKKMGGAAK